PKVMVCFPPPPLLPLPFLSLVHAASRPGTATTPAPTAAPRSTERRESWLGVSLDCVITPPTCSENGGLVGGFQRNHSKLTTVQRPSRRMSRVLVPFVSTL